MLAIRRQYRNALVYSTSKAEFIGLTNTISKEYALEGMKCGVIAPVVVRTRMVADMPDAPVKYMTDKIPIKRGIEVEERLLSWLVTLPAKMQALLPIFCWDATGGRSVY